jgi:hypothetical protein
MDGYMDGWVDGCMDEWKLLPKLLEEITTYQSMK